ncbi:MAG: protein kinase [Myxococcales bacterium]|nr:protein kinase [Polyangiaceae bacterium]MDW8249374.1 protein kinase [Myxococcales bacterium]
MPRAEQTSRPQPLARGDQIAERYTVVRELGRGGMAAVYLCRDSVTGDYVAIKVLFFESAEQTARYAIWFHQEARALAALDHPAIVRARDFGSTADGSPYLVMDALDGRSLHAWKQSLGSLPWPVIWSVVDQVLAGLAHAHARRIIHGDLKPSNIMLDPRDGVEPLRVYILDLGLAWLLTDHVDPRLVGTQIDAPAMPLGGGTPGWLAPEQIRHAIPHVGPPTDLYALGCILFELLSDREVFEGTTEQILRAHRDQPPPPPHLKPGVPEGVVPFTQRLLAKRPWHRFRLAADARAVWKTFQPQGQVHWAPSRSFERIHPTVSQSPRTPPASLTTPTKHLAPGILALRPCPLVGRDRERAIMIEMVERIVRGDGPAHRLLVLEGEAGVGKSRLSEWLCEYTHEHGLLLPLRARYQQIPSPSDGLRGAILAHYNLHGQPREMIEATLLNEWEISKNDDEGRTWVAATAQWLRPPAPDEPTEVGPAGKRFVVDNPEIGHAIVRHALSRIAQDRGLCIWLDDLHLASQATFDGLTALRQDLASLRFLLVATARTEALAVDPDATERLARLCATFPSVRLRVAPLDREQLRELLQSTLPLAPEAEEVVIARSHGNPLFALQLVHAWAGGGHFQLRGGLYTVSPTALQGHAGTTAELWEERLKGIPDAFRGAAYAAAALGTDIHIDPLRQLLLTLPRRRADSTKAPDVDAAIAALCRAQILIHEPGHRFRWAHALLHEHTMARLRESDNAAQVFRLAADALVFHPDAGTERIVRQRAHILLLAGEPEMAAEQVFHYVEASWSRLRDAATVRSVLSLLENQLSGKLLGVWRRWKAEVDRQAGLLAAARASALAAESYLSEVGEEIHRAHCLRLLGQIACDEGRPAAGRPLVEQAYAHFLSAGDDVGRAECEFVLGQIESLLGRYDTAIERLAHAAMGFQATGELLSLAQCTMVRARAEMAAGRLAATQQYLTEARAIFAELGYALGLAQVDLALAQAAHSANQHVYALERALVTKTRFESLGSARGRTDSARIAAMAAFDLGRFEEARKLAEEARLVASDEQRPDPWGKVEATSLLARISLATGNLKEASAWLQEANAVRLDDAEPTQHRELTQAWLHLAERRYVEVVTSVARARRAFSDPRRVGDHTPQLVERLLELARGTPAEYPLQVWHSALRKRVSVPPPPRP